MTPLAQETMLLYFSSTSGSVDIVAPIMFVASVMIGIGSKSAGLLSPSHHSKLGFLAS